MLIAKDDYVTEIAVAYAKLDDPRYSTHTEVGGLRVNTFKGKQFDVGMNKRFYTTYEVF